LLNRCCLIATAYLPGVVYEGLIPIEYRLINTDFYRSKAYLKITYRIESNQRTLLALWRHPE